MEHMVLSLAIPIPMMVLQSAGWAARKAPGADLYIAQSSYVWKGGIELE